MKMYTLYTDLDSFYYSENGNLLHNNSLVDNFYPTNNTEM